MRKSNGLHAIRFHAIAWPGFFFLLTFKLFYTVIARNLFNLNNIVYQASLFKPWFLFWRDPTRCQSVPKRVRVGIYHTELRPSAYRSNIRLLIIRGWQDRVVRKPVKVNLGLNVNWSIIFSCSKTFLASNVWCSLRLLQLKTEGQTI